MIFPHPESDLSINIMVLGTDIIKILKKTDFILIEKLLEKFLKKDKKRTPNMFLNTVSFLYCFDILERKGYKIGLKLRTPAQLFIFKNDN